MWWLLLPKRHVQTCLTVCGKIAQAMALQMGAVQLAADVVVILVETLAAIVVVALASPVKALQAVTMQTVAVLRLSAQHKLDAVVHLVTVVATTSSPATFATTQVAMWLVLAPTTKASATAPVVNPIHCAPAWTAWPVAAVVVVAAEMAAAASAVTVVATALAAVALRRVDQVAIRQGRLDVKNR
jgi:hypothetical protein